MMAELQSTSLGCCPSTPPDSAGSHQHPTGPPPREATCQNVKGSFALSGREAHAERPVCQVLLVPSGAQGPGKAHPCWEASSSGSSVCSTPEMLIFNVVEFG